MPSGVDHCASSDTGVLHQAEGAGAVPVRVLEGPCPRAVLQEPQRQEGRRRLRRSLPTQMLILMWLC